MRVPIRIPNESAEYRAARTALLAEEFELRRHIERVAAMRRALPPGGPVTGDYRFETEEGPSDLAGLFGDKETLVVYNYMFGPEREKPCPMCTNLLDAWDGNADDLAQRGLARGGRALAVRAARGGEARARLEKPQARQRPQRQFRAGLRRGPG